MCPNSSFLIILSYLFSFVPASARNLDAVFFSCNILGSLFLFLFLFLFLGPWSEFVSLRCIGGVLLGVGDRELWIQVGWLPGGFLSFFLAVHRKGGNTKCLLLLRSWIITRLPQGIRNPSHDHFTRLNRV